MILVNKITMDLTNRGATPVVSCKQGDTRRQVDISLMSDGQQWVIPENITPVVRFCKADGKSGIYDTLPDGTTPAGKYFGNVLKIQLAPQMLTCPGLTRMDVVLMQSVSHVLTTFSIDLLVNAAVTEGVDTSSQDYYKCTTMEQINAALDARVQSVNGIRPDSGGNVALGAQDVGAISQEQIRFYANLAPGMAIPAGTDLDLWRLPGTYTCSAAVTASLSHKPAGMQGGMELTVNRITEGTLRQIIRLEGDGCLDFIRSFDGTWSPWLPVRFGEYLTEKDVSQIAWDVLVMAKNSGNFKGEKGDSYVLTDADIQQIADLINHDTDPVIPALAEEMVDTLSKSRTSKCFCMAAFSDFHGVEGTQYASACVQAANGLRELRKRTRIHGAAMLGDYARSAAFHTARQTLEELKFVKRVMSGSLLGLPQIWCVGEQDLNTVEGGDAHLTEAELYAYICANSHMQTNPWDIDCTYGYLDFPDQHIRMICLNTSDTPHLDEEDYEIEPGSQPEQEVPYRYISMQQLSWLANKALDFSNKEEPREWGILLCSHYPLDQGVESFNQALRILEAYEKGGKGTFRVWEFGYYFDIDFDYTKTYHRGTCVCNLHGHYHNCAAQKIASDNGELPWLWRVCVPNVCEDGCNAVEDTAGDKTERDASGAPIFWHKSKDHAPTAFSVVLVDSRNHDLRVYSFGAGAPLREFNYYKSEGIMNHIGIRHLYISGDACKRNGMSYNAKFTPVEGYKLPQTVTIYLNDELITGYTYSPETGELFIPATLTTGYLNICAEGVPIA